MDDVRNATAQSVFIRMSGVLCCFMFAERQDELSLVETFDRKG